jgi:hypothetical protein
MIVPELNKGDKVRDTNDNTEGFVVEASDPHNVLIDFLPHTDDNGEEWGTGRGLYCCVEGCDMFHNYDLVKIP